MHRETWLQSIKFEYLFAYWITIGNTKLIHDYHADLVKKVKSTKTRNTITFSVHNFDQTYNMRPILEDLITLLHF